MAWPSICHCTSAVRSSMRMTGSSKTPGRSTAPSWTRSLALPPVWPEVEVDIGRANARRAGTRAGGHGAGTFGRAATSSPATRPLASYCCIASSGPCHLAWTVSTRPLGAYPASAAWVASPSGKRLAIWLSAKQVELVGAQLALGRASPIGIGPAQEQIAARPELAFAGFELQVLGLDFEAGGQQLAADATRDGPQRQRLQLAAPAWRSHWPAPDPPRRRRSDRARCRPRRARRRALRRPPRPGWHSAAAG